MTIDPANYKFEGNADGSFYFIKLDLENISIDTSYGTSGVAFATTPDYIYRYKKIDQTGTNTRYTSYGNSITMTPSGFMGGTFSTYYNPIDGTRGISSSDSGNYIQYLTAKSLHGDLTHITEDVGSYSTYMYLLFGDYSSYYYL